MFWKCLEGILDYIFNEHANSFFSFCGSNFHKSVAKFKDTLQVSGKVRLNGTLRANIFCIKKIVITLRKYDMQLTPKLFHYFMSILKNYNSLIINQYKLTKEYVKSLWNILQYIIYIYNNNIIIIIIIIIILL